MNKYGGNIPLEEITKIFQVIAKKYNLNYSHKKENQWNLWQQDSGLVLSFILNRGMFTPCLVGIKRETLERFYSSTPSNVDQWIKKFVSDYYFVLKDLLVHPESQQPPKEVAAVQRQVKRRIKKKEQVPGQLSFEDLGMKF